MHHTQPKTKGGACGPSKDPLPIACQDEIPTTAIKADETFSTPLPSQQAARSTAQSAKPLRFDSISSQHGSSTRSEDKAREAMLDQTPPMSIISIWMTSIQRVSHLRNVILAKRMDVKKERGRYYRQRQSFQDNRFHYMTTIRAPIRNVPFNEYQNRPEDLSRKLDTCDNDLKEQEQRINEAEENLSRLEYDLSGLEADIYRELDNEFRNLSSPSQELSFTVQPQPLSKANELDSGATIISPVDELYSRMGDLRILLDRLNDFEYDLRQELDERDMQRVAGQVQLTPDEQFFEERRKERTQIQSELDQAQADVSYLKDLCTQQGLPFRDVSFPDYSTATYGAGEEETSEHSQYVHPDNQHSTSSNIIDQFFHTRTYVTNWLEEPGMPETQQPMEEGTPKEAEVDTRSDSSWDFAQDAPKSRQPSMAVVQDVQDALRGMPEWNVGPPPGSTLLQALLLSSMSEHIDRPVRKRASYTSL